MPPRRRSRFRADTLRALPAGVVAGLVLLTAALRVAAVADELAGPDEALDRAAPARAPPVPMSTAMTRPTATYRDLRRRAKYCVSAFIPVSLGAQAGTPVGASWEQPG